MRHFIKHLSLVVTMFLSATFASAQSKVLESVGYNPDSLVHYYIFTGDTTYEKLPNEMGEVKPHRNKVSKITRIVKKAAGSGYILAEIIIESSQHIILITSLV